MTPKATSPRTPGAGIGTGWAQAGPVSANTVAAAIDAIRKNLSSLMFLPPRTLTSGTLALGPSVRFCNSSVAVASRALRGAAGRHPRG